MFYQSTRPPTFLFFFFILKKQKKQKPDLDYWFLLLFIKLWYFTVATHGEEKEGPWFLMFLHKIFELHIPKPDDLEFVKVHSVVDKGIRNTERNIKNIIFVKIKGVIR